MPGNELLTMSKEQSEDARIVPASWAFYPGRSVESTMLILDPRTGQAVSLESLVKPRR
jgi:hypothetical protein